MNAPVRISFEKVSVDFPTSQGPMRVLDDVSFDIRNGEFVSIIGPSGCGKTTMMNIVGGFVQPTQGRVLLDGKPVTAPGPDRGVIFQEYGVFPWLTVRQNIEFGLKLAASKTAAAERGEIVQRYMELMGLTDFADHFPKHLSGGMRQRLAIARAYAVKPEFLLMDEPFGALAALTREALNLELLRIWQASTKTVVLVTHSIEEAILLSDKVAVFSPRPGFVRELIDVPIARPRSAATRSDPVFIRLAERLRSHFEASAAA